MMLKIVEMGGMYTMDRMLATTWQPKLGSLW
jgi:hypothetical protein